LRKNSRARDAKKIFCIGVKGTLHVPAFSRRMHERFPETFALSKKKKLNKEGRRQSTASGVRHSGPVGSFFVAANRKRCCVFAAPTESASPPDLP
jgi:hypothetical protein